MVYILEMWCDGACRNNGRYNPDKPVVAGAGVYYPRGKRALRRQFRHFSRSINQGNQNATNNRAELEAVILALETALEVEEGLVTNPRVEVRINTDSSYVRNAMMQWRFKWQENGWRTSKGGRVANQDLFEEAIDLEERVEGYGADVYYFHVPREDNEEADALANEACDLAERKFNRRYGAEYF